jgi:ribosomal protein S24E
MTRGGIDVKNISSHSVRSAAVSKASTKFVSVDKILKVAGWSNAKTFAKFYKKIL